MTIVEEIAKDKQYRRGWNEGQAALLLKVLDLLQKHKKDCRNPMLLRKDLYRLLREHKIDYRDIISLEGKYAG